MKFMVAACLFALALVVPTRADTEAPVAVRTVAPDFPPEMRRQGINGLVVVSFLVDQQGAVQETKVVKSSNAAFTQPAIDAIKKWKFKPAQKDGSAVAVRVSVPVRFTIGD